MRCLGVIGLLSSLWCLVGATLVHAPTCEEPDDDESDATSFLATAGLRQAAASRSSAGGGGHGGRGPRKDPAWFGAFAEGESTYDRDADGLVNRASNPSVNYQDGWEPGVRSPYHRPRVAAKWFHESPSGGSKAAWQTHSPGLPHGIGQQSGRAGRWVRNAGGSWSQDYQSRENVKPFGTWISEIQMRTALPPDFFDGSVAQYDDYGRRKLPSPLSPRRYVNWVERHLNASMACASAGCVANVSLRAFDPSTERARFCKLSVYVHPTDYEDDHGGESVEWIQVNGETVNTHCKPGRRGCGETPDGHMHTCVLEFALDKFVARGGTLHISAKNSPAVDECPFQGNLLAAVPMVTCLVQNVSENWGSDHLWQDIRDGVFGSDEGLLTGRDGHGGTHESTYGGAYGSDRGGGDGRISREDATRLAAYGAGGYIATAAFGTGHGTVEGSSGSGLGGVYGVGGAFGIGGLFGPDGRYRHGRFEDGNDGWFVRTIENEVLRVIAPLQCRERGCTAEAYLPLRDPLNNTRLRWDSCKLFVDVNQTDYDNYYSVELIDFVEADGRSLITDYSPGQNPCKFQRLMGQPAPPESRFLRIIDGADVTLEAADDSIRITGKISDQVDECAFNGQLFAGVVEVACDFGTRANTTAAAASTQEPEV